MTVTVTTSHNVHSGDGSSTTFNYTFLAYAASEVQVEVDGTVISSALYSVDIDDSDYQGGDITFLTAPEDDAVIIIQSNPSFQQTQDFDNAGAFLPESHEQAFDKSVQRDLYLLRYVDEASGPAGPEGPQGIPGDTGPQGDPGPQGSPGAAATITVGTVTTGSPGTDTIITNVGTTSAAIFDFTVPRGMPGASGALSDATYSGIVVSGTGTALDVVAGHITLARMANLAQGLIIGRQDAAGTGAPQALTAAQVKTILALTSADITGLDAALALKAPLASPTFTGTVAIPTPAAGDNSTKAASTAFVKAQAYATLASPALTGNATIDGVLIGFRGAPLETISTSEDLWVAAKGRKIRLGGTTGTLTIRDIADINLGEDFVATGFNIASGNWTIARDTNVDLYKNGGSTSANVTVAPYGRFTLMYWGVNGGREKWTIEGTNLT